MDRIRSSARKNPPNKSIRREGESFAWKVLSLHESIVSAAEFAPHRWHRQGEKRRHHFRSSVSIDSPDLFVAVQFDSKWVGSPGATRSFSFSISFVFGCVMHSTTAHETHGLFLSITLTIHRTERIEFGDRRNRMGFGFCCCCGGCYDTFGRVFFCRMEPRLRAICVNGRRVRNENECV